MESLPSEDNPNRGVISTANEQHCPDLRSDRKVVTRAVVVWKGESPGDTGENRLDYFRTFGESAPWFRGLLFSCRVC